MKQDSITKLNHFIHGADYNPEQWRNRPDILLEDIRLMKLAGCNAMSIGIFSWASYEPQEGVYDFEWLDHIINTLYDNGIYTILATPSGARPAWLAQKYPEVLRTTSEGVKLQFGGRHNHCLTSPIYREKVAEINRILANRYKDHPAIIMWHVSNEYGGECFCEHCQSAFRDYIKAKYQTLDHLNEQYWAYFWSHTYTDWSQVVPPSRIGETEIHGLNLDWRRFVSDQTIDFFENEVKPIKALTPHIPITTNFMDFYQGLDYHKFAKHLDVVSLDIYPAIRHNQNDYDINIQAAMTYDLNRSHLGKPFILMESTPSTQNWQDIATLKRPGQHLLASLQAVAHGADSVQYFQWRKSRGSSEKFHGAVIDHVGHENTRVFKEVAHVGDTLKQIQACLGQNTTAQVALLFDWSNWWAIDNYQGYSNLNKDYKENLFLHYKALFEIGVNVDIISPTHDFTPYTLIIAPQLYMTPETLGQKIEHYVENGGNFVTTFISGIVNENDLVHLGGFPGPLRKTLGLWVEETDVLYPEHKNNFEYNQNHYSCYQYFDVIHLEGATAMSLYEHDYYKGQPVITCNQFGKGQAFYIGSKVDTSFLTPFYKSIFDKIDIKPLVNRKELGVDVTMRGKDHLFILNTSETPKSVTLNSQYCYKNLLDDKTYSGPVALKAFEYLILKQL